MGREIRMVPPNWQHPKYTQESAGWEFRSRIDSYMPMFDRTFAEACREWKKEFAKWEAGERPDYCDDEDSKLEYWEWSGEPPDRKYYRAYEDSEATWFQVYETVSEGTPVTPPFATREELVEYLIANGDFWDQQRWAEGNRLMQPTKPGYSRDVATRFVMGSGYAPSGVAIVTPEGTTFAHGIEAAALMSK